MCEGCPLIGRMPMIFLSMYHTRMEQQSSYWSTKPARKVEKNAFADLCASYLSGSEKLLDLGCGRGEDSLFFARMGCAMTAVDISEANVSHLRQRATEEGLSMQ